MLNDNPKTIYLWSDPYCITIHFIIRQLYLTIQSPWNRETFIPSASRSREAALPNEPDGEAPNASASLPKAAQRRLCAGSELVDQPQYCLPCHWTPCEHYTHKYNGACSSLTGVPLYYRHSCTDTWACKMRAIYIRYRRTFRPMRWSAWILTIPE